MPLQFLINVLFKKVLYARLLKLDTNLGYSWELYYYRYINIDCYFVNI